MCRSHRRCRSEQFLKRLAWLLPIMLSSMPAWAAPEPEFDPLYAVLAERGAVPTPSPLASNLRDQAAEMVVAAMNFVGVPYRRGGNDLAAGFDCSGFTRHIVALSLGRVLPRRVDDQASAKGMVAVGRAELRPGDLVFFNTLKRTFSHVGIYVGDGRFIHAPRSGSEVRIEDLRYAYWAQRFTGARRVALADAPAGAESTLLQSGS